MKVEEERRMPEKEVMEDIGGGQGTRARRDKHRG
jgi:hypothetical protein